MMILEDNQAKISGEIVSKLKFDHKVGSENFYKADVRIERFSGSSDYIPIVISDRIIDTKKNYVGTFVSITGQIRTHNKIIDNRRRLILYVFALEIEILEREKYENKIMLDGHVCKETNQRTTYRNRDISEVLISVNRPYGKKDYIPCICWGRNAIFASNFIVGNRIKVKGRLQSRVYKKYISETEFEMRMTYEVSVCDVEVLKDEN